MTYFMLPHVYGRLIPDNINLTVKNEYLKPNINYTLANYLSIAEKASKQYSEIWDSMIKITNMYGNLGDGNTQHYEVQEISNVFNLSHENTLLSAPIVFNNSSIIKEILLTISNSKKNTNSIIKVGNLFSQITIDCVYILSLCFNEVYIYKPASSPAMLDDKWLVCKDFKLISTDYLQPIFKKTLNILNIAENDYFYSLYNRKISNNYINVLVEANSVIGQQQLESINNTITLIEQGRKKEKIDALKRQQTVRCLEWHKKFGVILNKQIKLEEEII